MEQITIIVTEAVEQVNISVDESASGTNITVNEVQGPKGDKGDTGPSGGQGQRGDTGPQGIQGEVGPTGAASTVPGPQGERGERGEIGPQGPQGIQGAAGADSTVPGPQGEAGPQGPKGDTGLQGLKGDDGAKGDTGGQGPQGEAGPQGLKGDTGEVGPQGEQGIQGIQGPAGLDLSTPVGALQTEMSAARGDRSSLHLRISTISNFASPNAGGVIVGQYYDNSFQGTASSTLAGAANRLDMAPYYTSIRLKIDQIGVAVSTGVASAKGRICIYDTNADGWPDELLYYGDSDLDFAATGYKYHALDFTFDSGRQYWIGVHQSSTATLRTINASSAVNLGVNGSAGSNYFTILRRTITFGNALPNPWGFLTADRTANITPPSIRFRAATL